MPSCKDFTILFQSRVALQGPSSTKLLSMFSVFNSSKIRIFRMKTSCHSPFKILAADWLLKTDAILIGYVYFKVQNVQNKLNDHLDQRLGLDT